MANTSTKKDQTKYKVDYDKHVLFEPHVAAGDSVFVEWPVITASDADHIVRDGYTRLLPCCIARFRPINV